ncbi:MAG: response regulator transcription factor [Marinoscillum sp.]
MAKTILLVDDHKMIRDAIKQYLYDVERYVVTAEATNGQEAFEMIQQKKFDLVVTDINMPISDGLELVQNIRLNFESQLILALTMDISVVNIKKLYKLGVQGYVLKNVSPNDFIAAIDQLFHHKKYYSKEITDELKKVRRKDASFADSNLSKIECEVLKHLMLHTPNETICKELKLAPKVLDLLIKNLYKKSQCNSIPGLIVFGIENGLI